MSENTYSAIPDELQNRDQWLMWDASADTPRRPHWMGNFNVSWSDPDEWHSFEEAVQAAQQRESWGIGFVMAKDNSDHARGLYGCIDIDGGLTESGELKDWVPNLEQFEGDYMERSPSGTGIHIPFVGQDVPDWWSDSHLGDHEGVDVLTNKFCTFTGDTLDKSGDTVTEADLYGWLIAAYRNITGETPYQDGSRTPDTHHEENEDYDGDEWLDEEDIEDALSYIDPGVEYAQWLDIGYAVHAFFDGGSRGKKVFERWSRQSSKWDKNAQRVVDGIWETATPGDGITAGTLIYHAKQGGWEPPYSSGGSSQSGAGTGGSEAEGGETTFDGGGEEAQDPDSGGGGDWAAVRHMYDEADDETKRGKARVRCEQVLKGQYTFLTEKETGHIYVYGGNEGVYNESGEQKIQEALHSGLRHRFKQHEVNELEGRIRAGTQIAVDEFHGPEGKVCLENGVFDLEEMELEPHSPKYTFKRRLNVEYDPDAEAETFKECLEEWVDSGSQREKLQQYVGYCLVGWGMPFHKALFLAGPEASGKSTFIDAITTIFGEDSHTSLTPQQLVGERFQTIELKHSLINTSSDIPSELIEDIGTWKMISAGDRIKGERKYEDPIMFRPTTKHIFSANKLPDVYEADDAFWRRVLIVPFRNTIPKEDRDPKLQDKLGEEKQGIFNWVLEGYESLMEQRRFSADLLPKKTKDRWHSWGTSVPRFKGRVLRNKRGEQVEKAELYQAYTDFCRKHDMLGVSKSEFGKRLLKFPHIGKKEGRTQKVYTNIELRDDYQE